MDSRFLLRALLFAAERHGGQRRKDAGGSPYINHPIEVAALISDSGIDDAEILAAALLHDTVEDTATSIEEIEELFGAGVARTVEELTDDKSLPSEVRRRSQAERAASYSRGARLIRIADKVSNLRDVTDRPPVGWSQARRERYLDWAEKVAGHCRGVNRLLDNRFDEELRRARAAPPLL